MPHDRKIATCRYCGRRTVLELTARVGMNRPVDHVARLCMR